MVVVYGSPEYGDVEEVEDIHLWADDIWLWFMVAQDMET